MVGAQSLPNAQHSRYVCMSLGRTWTLPSAAPALRTRLPVAGLAVPPDRTPPPPVVECAPPLPPTAGTPRVSVTPRTSAKARTPFFAQKLTKTKLRKCYMVCGAALPFHCCRWMVFGCYIGRAMVCFPSCFPLVLYQMVVRRDYVLSFVTITSRPWFVTCAGCTRAVFLIPVPCIVPLGHKAARVAEAECGSEQMS